MKIRVARMYSERLEELIESIAIEYESLVDEGDLSSFQSDKLKALELLINDLTSTKRVVNFTDE